MDMKESLGPAAVFPLGEENEAYAQYFVGTSYLAPLTGADAGVSVSNVTFEPGCRNNWHVHHVGGQNQLSDAAPCQCFVSGGMLTASPGLSSRAGRPHSW